MRTLRLKTFCTTEISQVRPRGSADEPEAGEVETAEDLRVQGFLVAVAGGIQNDRHPRLPATTSAPAATIDRPPPMDSPSRPCEGLVRPAVLGCDDPNDRQARP